MDNANLRLRKQKGCISNLRIETRPQPLVLPDSTDGRARNKCMITVIFKRVKYYWLRTVI